MVDRASRRLTSKRKAKQSTEKLPACHIVATSKSSRFHEETVETLSNDVHLTNVSLHVNGEPLLQDTTLKLFNGRRYSLVGRNGIGKSVLMQSIGEKLLVGFPKNIRVLHIKQIESIPDSMSVLDVVKSANVDVFQQAQQLSKLQTLLDSQYLDLLCETMKSMKLRDIEVDLVEARRRAEHRTGARGAEARRHLNELERKYSEAVTHPISLDENENIVREAQAILALGYQKLDEEGFEAQEQRVRKILNDLKFPVEWQDRSFNLLSGGWRARVSLAQALFIEPDILLLDEPTNHLDMPAIAWLKKKLRKLDCTMLVVSHDRDFLNAVTDETIIFKNKHLTYYDGNYDEAMSIIEDRLKDDTRFQQAKDRKIAHIEKSIEEGLKHAKATGDDKKLGMIASRRKKLDPKIGEYRMIERNVNGHKFVASRHRHQLGGMAIARANLLFVEPPPHFDIPPTFPLRHNGSLVEVDNVSFKYGFAEYIIKSCTLNISPKSRIALVGANGQGKTTLVNLICMNLRPNSGRVTHHPELRIGHLDQHAVGSLRSLNQSALEYLSTMYPNKPEQEYRSKLASFGLNGTLATNPLSSLSGGQANRACMASITFNNPNLLVLDEPTNHLDLDTINALKESIEAFNGAVLIVSHDIWFCKAVANEIYLVDQALVSKLDGVEQYVKKLK